MKSMTKFQEALLASAEAQFADVPEDEQIQITPSAEFYKNIPKGRKPFRPLRRAVLIAAALALFVGIAFAAHNFALGNTEVEIYQYPLTAKEIANGATAGNYVIELKFQEDFSDANAPDSIETFYIPTSELLEAADHANCDISNSDYRYNSSLSKEEIEEWNHYYENLPEPEENSFYVYKLFTDRIPENPSYFNGEWFVDETQIMFTQTLAKRIPEIDQYTIQYPGEWNPETVTERLIIGNYEVLSVFVEFDYPDAAKHSAYHWFWTNGEYFFSIMADDVDQTFMQELMESVQPIEDIGDIETYFGQK